MTQQEFWNQKFSREDFLYGMAPNRFIEESAHIIPRNGRVLCLGEGEGRNAVFLAKMGFGVCAIDASDQGLEKARQYARHENVDIETLHLDLAEWKETPSEYDAVVSSYMHLPEPIRMEVFTKALRSIRKGGFLIAEFFSQDQLAFQSGGPKDEALLYTLQEFENLFRTHNTVVHKLSKELVHLQEGVGHQGDGSVIRVIVEVV